MSTTNSPSSHYYSQNPMPMAAAAEAGSFVGGEAGPWLEEEDEQEEEEEADRTTSSAAVDVEQMTRTLTTIRAKNIRPDLLSSIVTHYASKWLPTVLSSPAGSTSAWLKKRSFVEALVSLLPPAADADDAHLLPCDFLLRLLRAACMVGAGADHLDDVEARVARQLDRATLRELAIPAFSHTCGTLLDFPLVARLVGRFLLLDEAARSGAAVVKVARLVDCYLAEAAADAGLAVTDFEDLARALPGHARATDDGLYRAVDTYIKAHPCISKQERKALCRLIDPRKLTQEASLHAVHNDRLPIRSVIQVMFSEQSKLSRITTDCGIGVGSSFSGPRSPNLPFELPAAGGSSRCPSSRDVVLQQAQQQQQQQDVVKLREDVARLQAQCRALQAQVDGLVLDHKKKKGFFNWSSFLFWNVDSAAADKFADDYGVATVGTGGGGGKKAGQFHRGKATPPKWRNSMS